MNYEFYIDDRRHSTDSKIDKIRKHFSVGKYHTSVKWSSNTGKLYEIDIHHLVNWIKDLSESINILESWIKFKDSEVNK